MRDRRTFLFGAGMVLGTMFVAGLLISFNVGNGVNPSWYTKSFKPVVLDAVADGATLESEVEGFWVYPHAADPVATYATNITAGYYATATVNNTHAGSDVPYSTLFDCVWKVRWNVTHAWNGTGWDSTYTRGFCNCSGLGVSADSLGQQLIGYNESFVWYNYYIQDTDGGAGAGFTITKGQNVTSCAANWEAYY